MTASMGAFNPKKPGRGGGMHPLVRISPAISHRIIPTTTTGIECARPVGWSGAAVEHNDVILTRSHSLVLCLFGSYYGHKNS